MGDGRRQVTVFAPNNCPRSRLIDATDDPVERIKSARFKADISLKVSGCSPTQSSRFINHWGSRNPPSKQISTRRILSCHFPRNLTVIHRGWHAFIRCMTPRDWFECPALPSLSTIASKCLSSTLVISDCPFSIAKICLRMAVLVHTVREAI